MNNTTTTATKTYTTPMGRKWTMTREFPYSPAMHKAIGCIRQESLESVKGRGAMLQVFENGTARITTISGRTEYLSRGSF